MKQRICACPIKVFGVAVAVLVFFGSARIVVAQLAAGGSISGVVKDEQGAVLPGVTVAATSASAPGVHTTITDGQGLFRMVDLAPSEYAITCELSAFAKLVRDNVVVREGLNLSLDLTMKVGAVSDVVQVTAETPMLESKTVEQAVNISGDLQRALPLSSLRTWADGLLLVPGVVTSQARFQTYFLHGTLHNSGVVLVDGADATSVLQGSTLYSQFGRETFSDIQVKTGAVDAATPLGLGIIANIATQSGTNQLHGAAGFQYEPQSWNGDNATGGQSLTVTTQQSDFSLGGPIVRDEAWFFGSFRLARNATGVPRSAQQQGYLQALVPGYTSFDNAWDGQIGFVKVTAQLSPKHEFLASYSRDVTTYGGAQNNEAGTFRNIVSGGPGYFGRLSSIWSSSLTSRLSVGYNAKGQDTQNLNSNVTGVNIYQSTFLSGGRLVGNGLLAAVNASPFSGVDYPVHMWTISGDATYYRNGRWGSHELQAGVYLQPQRHDQQISQYNNNGFQLEEAVLRDPNNLTAGYVPFHRQIFTPSQVTTLDVDSRDNAVYAQDAWRPSDRVTVSAGLRVDFVKRVDQIFNVVTQDSTEVGPRFGVNYILTADQRNVVRASWGRVHENLSVNETAAGTNVAGFTDLYDTAGNGSFSTVFVTPPVTARSSNIVIDLDHYHQEHVDELIVGYQRQLRGQVSVDISVIRREYRDRPAAVETNGIYNGNVFVGYRDPTHNDIYQLTANTWNWPVTTAFQIEASKRASRVRWIAGYTREWDHLAGTWQPNDPASFLQPAAFANENGIGFVNGCTSGPCADSNSLSTLFPGTWSSHVVNAGASYQAPWGLQLATTYNFQSGPWSGPILAKLPAADPSFGPPTVTLPNGRVVSNPLATPIRFAYATRADGQFRLPAVHLWNVRVGKTFPLGARRLETDVDLLNVTNHAADQALQIGGNQSYNPFFGTGMTRQFPRAVQLSARFVF